MSEKRDSIIVAASALMERQGYHGTGLNELVAESGAPKGSLYHYFPEGKDQITEEALRRTGAEVEANIRRAMSSESSAAEAIASLVEMIADRVEASDFAAGGPLTTVALETAASSERLRRACEEIYESWRAALRDRLLEDGVAPGRARSLAQLVISSIEGAVVLARTGRTTEPLEATAAELESLVRVVAG
jgi:TetR/AcrR family transcriptional repressor of lmrAB and yxaGH operons